MRPSNYDPPTDYYPMPEAWSSSLHMSLDSVYLFQSIVTTMVWNGDCTSNILSYKRWLLAYLAPLDLRNSFLMWALYMAKEVCLLQINFCTSISAVTKSDTHWILVMSFSALLSACTQQCVQKICMYLLWTCYLADLHTAAACITTCTTLINGWLKPYMTIFHVNWVYSLGG